MLRGVGIGYLVCQWRLAIELRADHAATKMMTTTERKNYAALLLNGIRSSGHHADGGALPCPTAHLTSKRHRSVKMRLTQIMENKSNPRKPRWRVALLLTTLGASTLGLISTSASAKDEEITIQADKIIYQKRTPPKMPASCPGLNVDDIEVGGKEMNINGVSTYQHYAVVGSVVLKFDIRPDGSTYNLRVVESNNACFEPEAKASVAQWITEPHGNHVREVAVILQFMLTGETHEDINGPLNEFLQ